MSSASSSRCALRRPSPPIALIVCPDCGRIVKQGRSGTPNHPGWIYYKCKNHGSGCNFWNWELGYVGYLVENNHLSSDAAVDALGWAEERREELELRGQEARVTTVQGPEQHMMMILVEFRKMLVLLKFAVGLLFALCAMLAVVLVKK